MRSLVLALSIPALFWRAGPPQDSLTQTLDGTVVRGGAVSGTWTKAGSPYFVLGDVFVDTLVVEAGVEVRSAPGVEIRVTGSIACQGTAAMPVRFTSLDARKRWDRLRLFFASGDSSFTYTRIDHTEMSAALMVQGARASTFAHCELVDNESLGLYVSAVGDFHMEDCLIDGGTVASTSTFGGGISVNMAGTFSMERCTVRGNRSHTQTCGRATGAGINVLQAAEVFLTDVLVEDNDAVSFTRSGCSCVAYAAGGGIALGCGCYPNCVCSPVPQFDATLTRCIVRGNRALAIPDQSAPCTATDAYAEGAGIHYAASGTLTLDNVIVADNVAWADGNRQWSRGAGLFFEGTSLVATNCTLVRNVAVDGQAIPGTTLGLSPGIDVESGSAVLRNSILFENDTCAALDLPGTGGCGGASQSGDSLQGDPALVEYCDVEGGEPGTGNLQEPPLLAGRGTTYADLSIAPGSPCIDRGDPLSSYDDVSFPPSLGGARNDVGHNGGPLAGGWLAWGPLLTRADR
jgi:hypothetical protein